MDDLEDEQSGAWNMDSTGLPADIVEQASRRLATFAGVIAAFVFIEGLVGHLTEYQSDPTYPTPEQRWNLVGLAAMISVSLVAFLILRMTRWTAEVRRALGIAYLLGFAALLSLTDHVDHYWKGGHQTHGVPIVTVLIVVFPVIVPMRPLNALWIGLAMAATSPLSIYALATTLDYEQPTIEVLLDSFPFVFAVFAAGLAQIVHQLGVKLKKARQLGSYTLIEKIGEGGMGVVYRARHAMLQRPTAIKLLPADKVGASSLARFEMEVQLTAKLTHANTVTVFDYGRTPGGVFYYAMELLEGATLAEVVAAGGPLSESRVVRILGQVAGALAEAHGVHLIHRDIKPANIMLSWQGGRPDVAKVLDFGLVRELDRVEDTVTATDVITGTPQYLAPEAIKAGHAVGPSIDIYALGAVGYFLLTGQHVFSANTVVEVCAAHLHDAPVPPSKRLGRPITADLESLILRCLAKESEGRPQDAEALRRELLDCAVDDEWTDDMAREWWQRYPLDQRPDRPNAA